MKDKEMEKLMKNMKNFCLCTECAFKDDPAGCKEILSTGTLVKAVDAYGCGFIVNK